MSDVSLDVPEGEGGILRLFVLDIGMSEGAALRDALRDDPDMAGAPVGRALGTESVDPWWVTLVMMRDLREIGLAGYLSEGYEIPADVVNASKARLVGPEDVLMLVQSPAFGGGPATIAPAPFLTPLAQFDTVGSPAPARAIKPVAAGPQQTPPPETPPAPAASTPLRPVVILALLAAAAIVVALVGLGGN